MSNGNDTTLWGIHAGKSGDADTLFLKKHCIGVGWVKMGDLSALKAGGVIVYEISDGLSEFSCIMLE